MATELLLGAPYSGVAGADLRGKEKLFVKPHTVDGRWVLCGEGEFGLPLIEGANTGGAISIGSMGSVLKMLCGAAINAGSLVKSDAASKARTAVKANTEAIGVQTNALDVVGSFVNGIALSTTANANEIVEVLVLPAGLTPTTPA